MKNKILAYCINISIIIIFFVMSLDYMCFNKNFYNYEYKASNVYETIKISYDDLDLVTDKLHNYLKGHCDDLLIEVMIDGQKTEMFNQKEIEHMVDVKELYLNVKNVSYISFIVLIICMIFFIYKNNNIFKELNNSFKKVIIGLGAIITALLTYAMIDFYNFWNMFHEIMFDNDLWLLNPNTDRMILMVPEKFFFDLVISITSIFIIVLLLYYFIINYMFKKETK